jgi:hypothetical protein
MILIAILGQRIVLPFGGYEISVVLVSQYLILGTLLLRGAVTISSERLLFWGAASAGLAISVALAYARGDSSLTSFLLLLLAYSPLSLCIVQPQSLERLIRTFSALMSILALVGIVQVSGQVLGIPKYDPLALLPEAFLSKSFHNHIRLGFDADYFKADGIVFAEPSFFSQFLAFAILLHINDVVLSARLRIGKIVLLLFLLSAMFLTFSGTGVLALAVGLLWLIRRERLLMAAAIGATLTSFATIAILLPWGHYFSSRLHEFQQEDSSAYRRFINPYVRVVQATLADDVVALTGHGPGTIDRLDERDEEAFVERDAMSVVVEEDAFRTFNMRSNRKEALSPSFIKCFYEYGLFSLPLLAYLATCFWSGGSPASLRAATFASLFFLGGNLLFVPLVAICHMLGTIQVPGAPVGLKQQASAPSRR